MATIRAFKGIRPDKKYAKDVAALPYDVMSSDEARDMVKGNPYSFLHVDKAEIDLDINVDLYAPEVYKKAKANLDKMLTDKVLIQDDEPALYIYKLTMGGRSQTGLVVCTSVEEYNQGIIKKHELTREAKEQDRIRHVDVCNANTGPIFMAYRAQKDINLIMENWIKNNKSEYDFVSEDEIRHEAWVINDSEAISSLVSAFQKVPSLYIADGHHRNASAAKVAIKRREQANNKAGEYDYYLSVLFPDDQLFIMDYNRLVKDLNGLSVEEFIKKASEKFDIEEKSGEYKPDSANTFGMYLNKRWYKLKAKEAILKVDPVEGLDVSILQNELLSPILAIGDIRLDSRIDFVGGMRGLKELVKRVDSGEMEVAFAMYPTSMAELLAVADSARIMPPKSTWFEPKLRSGVFIHSLE